MRHSLYLWIAVCGALAMFAMPVTAQEAKPKRGDFFKVLADERIEDPLKTIATEFQRRAETRIVLNFLPAAEVNALAKDGKAQCDVVLCMPPEKEGETAVSSLDGATTVAWKHPGGTPVWAAAITNHPQAASFVRFVGGPTGHLRWSESTAGFTIVGGRSHAEAIDWVAKNRVAHTYPLTAARMLGEIGGIREEITTEKLREIVAESGVADAQVIDARGQWVKIFGPNAPQAARRSGLGPHMLASRFIADYAIAEGKCLLVCPNDGGGVQSLQQGFLELTDLEITALYPSEEVVKEAELRIAKANLKDRISCTVGKLDDNLPFQADSFDLIAGIGPVLIWGDREKKMRDVYRVLRPGGAALFGGKYLGMPDFRKVSSEDLRASAVKTGISSIQVIDNMGQWVEIRKGIKDRGLRD